LVSIFRIARIVLDRAGLGGSSILACYPNVPRVANVIDAASGSALDSGLDRASNAREATEDVWQRIVRHLERERRPGLAKAKRTAFIKEHGKLSCEDCGMTPAEVYGSDVGEACIEVHHHALRVAEMDAGHETKLSDLKCLCANCHRLLHRRLAIGLL
jgi:predicted HNH restriction endonuclease